MKQGCRATSDFSCHLSGLGPRAGCRHAWLCPRCRAPPSSPELLVGLSWKNVLENDDLGRGCLKSCREAILERMGLDISQPCPR